MTRQQQMMSKAIEHLNDVKTRNEKLQESYRTLCHKFPVLIRTCGLCQTAAFVQEKASSNPADEQNGQSAERKARADANSILARHALDVLREYGFNTNGTFVTVVAKLTRSQYMLATRVLLDSWIYYKRFAESILDVKAGDSND